MCLSHPKLWKYKGKIAQFQRSSWVNRNTDTEWQTRYYILGRKNRMMWYKQRKCGRRRGKGFWDSKFEQGLSLLEGEKEAGEVENKAHSRQRQRLRIETWKHHASRSIKSIIMGKFGKKDGIPTSCYNKLPQTGCLKIIKIISSWLWRPEV